ncbi:MAG: circadian clock protein KaiC, partial [Promethearchaeota archaeon]
IQAAVEKIGAKRVVLDSLAALFTQFPDASLIRKEILRIKSCLNTLSVTSIITSERYEDHALNSHYDIMDFVSDNLIILKNTSFNEYRRRTIEILKYRGTSHKKGQYSFTIRDNRGIVIISFEREPNVYHHERQRISSGLEDLDGLIDGGFFQGSSILISGQTGTGKTLLLLSMIEGALNRGEKCILFNFEESRDQILKKAHNWNIDLEQKEQEGLFRLLCLYPESTGIEDLIVEIKTAIQTFSPDRVFIDSISALERITSEITYRESLINVILYLREMNIIGFLTSTTPTFASPSFGSGIHISTLSDAIILLRYFEQEGKLIRGMAIMKLRDSDHSKSFMEYQIDGTGIHILKPIEQNAGIFS